jgi:hypothetical protein
MQGNGTFSQRDAITRCPSAAARNLVSSQMKEEGEGRGQGVGWFALGFYLATLTLKTYGRFKENKRKQEIQGSGSIFIMMGKFETGCI